MAKAACFDLRVVGRQLPATGHAQLVAVVHLLLCHAVVRVGDHIDMEMHPGFHRHPRTFFLLRATYVAPENLVFAHTAGVAAVAVPHNVLVLVYGHFDTAYVEHDIVSALGLAVVVRYVRAHFLVAFEPVIALAVVAFAVVVVGFGKAMVHFVEVDLGSVEVHLSEYSLSLAFAPLKEVVLFAVAVQVEAVNPVPQDLVVDVVLRHREVDAGEDAEEIGHLELEMFVLMEVELADETVEQVLQTVEASCVEVFVHDSVATAVEQCVHQVAGQIVSGIATRVLALAGIVFDKSAVLEVGVDSGENWVVGNEDVIMEGVVAELYSTELMEVAVANSR